MNRKIKKILIAIFIFSFLTTLKQNVQAVGFLYQAWVENDKILFRTYTTPYESTKTAWPGLAKSGGWAYYSSNTSFFNKSASYYNFATVGLKFHKYDSNECYYGFSGFNETLAESYSYAYTPASSKYNKTADGLYKYIYFENKENPTTNDIKTIKLLENPRIEPAVASGITYKKENDYNAKSGYLIESNTMYRMQLYNDEKIYVTDRVITKTQQDAIRNKGLVDAYGKVKVSNILQLKNDSMTSTNSYTKYYNAKTFVNAIMGRGFSRSSHGMSNKNDGLAYGSVLNLFDNTLQFPNDAKRTVLVRHVNIGDNSVINEDTIAFGIKSEYTEVTGDKVYSRNDYGQYLGYHVATSTSVFTAKNNATNSTSLKSGSYTIPTAKPTNDEYIVVEMYYKNTIIKPETRDIVVRHILYNSNEKGSSKLSTISTQNITITSGEENTIERLRDTSIASYNCKYIGYTLGSIPDYCNSFTASDKYTVIYNSSVSEINFLYQQGALEEVKSEPIRDLNGIFNVIDYNDSDNSIASSKCEKNSNTMLSMPTDSNLKYSLKEIPKYYIRTINVEETEKDVPSSLKIPIQYYIYNNSTYKENGTYEYSYAMLAKFTRANSVTASYYNNIAMKANSDIFAKQQEDSLTNNDMKLEITSPNLSYDMNIDYVYHGNDPLKSNSNIIAGVTNLDSINANIIPMNCKVNYTIGNISYTKYYSEFLDTTLDDYIFWLIYNRCGEKYNGSKITIKTLLEDGNIPPIIKNRIKTKLLNLSENTSLYDVCFPTGTIYSYYSNVNYSNRRSLGYITDYTQSIVIYNIWQNMEENNIAITDSLTGGGHSNSIKNKLNNMKDSLNQYSATLDYYIFWLIYNRCGEKYNGSKITIKMLLEDGNIPPIIKNRIKTKLLNLSDNTSLYNVCFPEGTTYSYYSADNYSSRSSLVNDSMKKIVLFNILCDMNKGNKNDIAITDSLTGGGHTYSLTNALNNSSEDVYNIISNTVKDIIKSAKISGQLSLKEIVESGYLTFNNKIIASNYSYVKPETLQLSDFKKADANVYNLDTKKVTSSLKINGYGKKLYTEGYFSDDFEIENKISSSYMKKKFLDGKKTIGSSIKYTSNSSNLKDNLYYSDESVSTIGVFTSTTTEINNNYSKIINIFTPISVSISDIKERNNSQSIKLSQLMYSDKTDITSLQNGFQFSINTSKYRGIYNNSVNINTYKKLYYFKFDFDIRDMEVINGNVTVNNKNYDGNSIITAGTWVKVIYNGNITVQANATEQHSDDVVHITARATTINMTDEMEKNSLLVDKDEIKNAYKNDCNDLGEDNENNYLAETVVEIKIKDIPKLYDFKVTDVKDINWKNVFRYSNNKHKGVAYYVGTKKLDPDKGIVTRSVKELGTNPTRTLPIGPYKNTNSSYVKAPKIGYRFSFSINRTGEYGAYDVKITPSFYYISKKGKEYNRNIQLYFKNSSGKYVRFDGNGNYPLTFIPKDNYRYVETNEENHLESKAQKLLDKDGNIVLKATTMSTDSGSFQTYYGEYKLPNSTIAIKKNKNGNFDITDKTTWLKDGYIGIRFNITNDISDNSSEKIISYDVGQEMDETIEKVNTSQWEQENYLGVKYKTSGNNSVNIKLEKDTWNRNYADVKGTVILYDIDAAADTDYN